MVTMAGYGALLAASFVWMANLSPDSPWRWVAMALPLPAVIAVVFVVGGYLLRTDELQSRIQLQALSLAFAAGSAITFTYGLMELAGAPVISWLFVWPVYAACWAICFAVVRRRY
jgi:hypothetical protein